MQNNDTKPIVSAIILAGALIAGAILLRGAGAPKDLTKASPQFNQCLDSAKYAQNVTDAKDAGNLVGVSGTPKGFIFSDGKLVATIDGAEPLNTVKEKIDKAVAGTASPIENFAIDRNGKKVTFDLPPTISASDRYIGNLNAKVQIVMYEDFQCPYCGIFVKQTEQSIRDTYVKNGQAAFAYRDFAFLGPESLQAAQAGLCAAEQGKFWELHDYLFAHQMGENQGAFSDERLKTFAGTLKLK